MNRIQSRVTERTFYDGLMEIIRSRGGEGVQEIAYNSVPDIQFILGGRSWLLSVKIGEDLRTIKDAFLQYLRHKDESGINLGMLLLLPESFRKISPEQSQIQHALNSRNVTALIDADLVKEEFRDRAFPSLVDFLIQEVLSRLAKKTTSYYPLKLVISLLKQHVSDMMDEISLDEDSIMRIITDEELLAGVGNINQTNVNEIARFLASYIFLSQLLFLRLLSTARPDIVDVFKPVSHSGLRKAFRKVLDINYRPIYEVDILDSIDDKYLKDTFDLIWGLEIERVRYELPGRIFHELMPSEIRKMLAAFYTRPLAADLLSNLTIMRSSDIVFDPACGSGTILTSAYRRKLDLLKNEGKAGNPHKRFCEDEIIGADIMPFAVHLTSANLAAMNPAVIIEKTQIIRGDSIELESGSYSLGMQLRLYPEKSEARTSKGDRYAINLKPVDSVIMNPPFTKVERGIRKFVNMDRFHNQCGGEVGLWGHFIALSRIFLKDEATFGAVLPINLLRGRESEKVRKILFEEFTPLYIIKPTLNYGFSEWSEYRDVLFIAKNKKPSMEHKVKFCLVKKDLTQLSDADVVNIADSIERESRLRGDSLVDIDSHGFDEINNYFPNMMWFIGVTDFNYRDRVVEFLDKFNNKLSHVPDNYFREGFRPVPSGVSQFLFLTRRLNDSRIERAFLSFSEESKDTINSSSNLGVSYKVEVDNLMPTLRTSVGMTSMDITDKWDYIAYKPYKELKRVLRAIGTNASPDQNYWFQVKRELDTVKTNLVVSHRINPFSPSTCLNAFFSDLKISPSNQVNVILENDIERAKALCVILNSIIFFAQFFILKEESTGRYINIRFYDLEQMIIYPTNKSVQPLIEVYEKYHKKKFPSLKLQFDTNFDERYQEFWDKQRGSQQEKLWSVINQPLKPFSDRINLDMAVCKALDLPITKEDIMKIYEFIVNEMICIRGLKRD